MRGGKNLFPSGIRKKNKKKKNSILHHHNHLLTGVHPVHISCTTKKSAKRAAAIYFQIFFSFFSLLLWTLVCRLFFLLLLSLLPSPSGTIHVLFFFVYSSEQNCKFGTRHTRRKTAKWTLNVWKEERKKWVSLQRRRERGGREGEKSKIIWVEIRM